MLVPVCSSMLVAHLCQCAQCGIVVVCVCGCLWVHFSPFSLHQCMCVCVCMWVCWGGLMGSVGARVPGEQLSLIIQTRLIIKAAQISPWFHLNCRQAAPLRQAVVTLGRLSVSFSPPLQGLLCSTLFCSVSSTHPYHSKTASGWPTLVYTLIAVTYYEHAIYLYLKMCLIYFWLDTGHALFGHRYGMFCYVGQQRRKLQDDVVGCRTETISQLIVLVELDKINLQHFW